MATENILLITSDQRHWNTLGILNPEVKTPNLDRLAARGVTFTRAYTVNPTCTPTGTKDPQKRTWNIPEEYHYDTWIAERTNALLEQYSAADKPFFLWSSFFDPHPSYLVPEPWDTMYDPDSLTVPSKVEGEHGELFDLEAVPMPQVAVA